MRTAQIKLLSAMALWGTMSLFVKNINLTSAEIALYRAIIAVVTLVLLRVLLHQKIDWQACRKDWLGLLISGSALGLNWTMLFSSYQYVPVSVATLCYYFAPTLIILFSALLFHEVMNRRQWLCFIVSTLGLILIINVSHLDQQPALLKGIFFGLSAAVFYAIVMLANKTIHHTSGLERTLIQLSISIVFLLPYCLFNGISIQSITLPSLLNLFILGVIYTAFAYFLFFSAIKELPGQKAALLTYIDPLTAILTSALILHETIVPIQLFGGLLIICAALISELTPKGKIKADEASIHKQNAH